MKKLMPERIVRVAELPLTPADRSALTERRNKQLLFIIPVYLVISTLCLLFGLTWIGPRDLNNTSFRINFSASETETYQQILPFICGTILLGSTIYMVKICFRIIHTVNIELKNGKKSLLYYIPIRSAVAAFHRYYFSTPLYRDQQVEVSKEVYEDLADNEELCLEVTSSSSNVLRLSKKGKEIDYD